MTRKKKQALLAAVKTHIRDCKSAVLNRQNSPELTSTDLTHYANGMLTVLTILGIDQQPIVSEFEEALAELIDSNSIRRMARYLFNMILQKTKGNVIDLPEPERRLLIDLHTVLHPPGFVKPN